MKKPPKTVKDIDGNIYKSVVIGSQVWMAENLRTIHFRNGELIYENRGETNWELFDDPMSWKNFTRSAFCYYGNSPLNGLIYGLLYNWFAVNDPRGLAPNGWHIATNNDWTALLSHLGENGSGDKLKEFGTKHWGLKCYNSNMGATNLTGFTALPGGLRLNNGGFSNIGVEGCWWISNDPSSDFAWSSKMFEFSHSVIISTNSKNCGCSVRLIRD